MSAIHHISHWGSWLGTAVALHGMATGDVVREYLGVAAAVSFSLLSAYVYLRQVLFASELRRDAQREQFRRDQELLDAQHRVALERLTREADASPSP